MQDKLQVQEVELIYKSTVKPSDRPYIKTSKDAYDIFKENWDDGKLELCEQFAILLLNSASRATGIYKMSTGGIGATIADIRLAFAAALKANAVGMIIAHNHPSSSLNRSTHDDALTKKFVAAGDILCIPVKDHVIIGAEGYYSYADAGMLCSL